MIDTPGYPDLIGQTIGALRAVETALIAIDAHAGIKVNTRRVWQEAGDAGLGRILVHHQARHRQHQLPEASSIRSKRSSASQCALFNVPIGQGHELKGVVSTLDVPKDTAGALIDPAEVSESVMESIIEADEAVMEKYFEGEMPSKEELARLCSEAVRQGTLTPIVCVSTKKGVGLDELLAVLGAGLAAADGRAAHGEEGRRRRDAQSRPGCAARRPSVQDAHRSVRAAAKLHPRVLRAR